jgi:hypothetical protein
VSRFSLALCCATDEAAVSQGQGQAGRECRLTRDEFKVCFPTDSSALRLLTRLCSVSASSNYQDVKSEPSPSCDPIPNSRPQLSYCKKKVKPESLSSCSRRSIAERPGPTSSQFSDDRTTSVTFPEEEDLCDPRFLRSDAVPSRRMTDNDLYFVVTRGVAPGVYKGRNAAESALGSFGHRVYYKAGTYTVATARFVKCSMAGEVRWLSPMDGRSVRK